MKIDSLFTSEGAMSGMDWLVWRVPARRIACLALLSLSGLVPVRAQVAVDGTRVIFPAGAGEVTVGIQNRSEQPALVQAWIGGEDAKLSPEASTAPFVVAPPLLRLDAGKDQRLRVRLIRDRAPDDDREHMYWLNILAAPPQSAAADDENLLQVAIRSRFKVLYRPSALAASLPANFAERMTFAMRRSVSGLELVISNPTPYHFNLGQLAVALDGKLLPLDNPYVAPFSERSVPLPAEAANGVSSVKFAWLDDNGQLQAGSRQLESP
ncbi:MULTISPECIES: molecular chaperone [Stenotrophomonas]|uniref:fimbria/pilus periplasmic chaperone n=1 Tax=Stenotrophomonas TaxID=40323 RepID=UPI0015DEBFC7|nr:MULTISPECIES: molecular chaperone [unclassified Stenotrophomonas]MDH0273597.1 molecular chaperone [Stenotrophomonas sp. GD04089]MDH1910436.1 molecular chaperone [Stenotrophomonas sp. GD03794]